MRIVMDMDQVIVDMMNPLLRVYNGINNKMLTLEDITEYQLPEDMLRLIYRKNFFLELPPMPGAIDGMRTLGKHHDIIIASSPSEDGEIAKEKMVWTTIWLPEFLPHLHLVHRKDRLIGDAMVDDCPEYLESFDGVRIVRDMPYNRHLTFDERVNGWDDILEVFGCSPSSRY